MFLSHASYQCCNGTLHEGVSKQVSQCMLDIAMQGLHAWFSKYVYMPGSKAHMHSMMLFLMYGAREFMHGKGSKEQNNSFCMVSHPVCKAQ